MSETMMPTQLKITKWGNSLGLRVPRDVAARAGLTEGARVDIEGYEDGRIVITRSRRRFTLEELLAGMTPEKEHPLEDDGPVGRELL
jgi:antitoxin MazE